MSHSRQCVTNQEVRDCCKCVLANLINSYLTMDLVNPPVTQNDLTEVDVLQIKGCAVAESTVHLPCHLQLTPS